MVTGCCLASNDCLIESIDTAVLVVSAHGTIRYCNRRAATLLERDASDIAGRLISEVLTDFNPTTLASEPQTAEPSRQLTRRSRSDGTEMLLGYRVSHSYQQDGSLQYVVIFQDVTRFSQLQKQHERALQLAVVGDVVPTLLNELKNPLGAAVTAVEMLFEEAHEDSLKQDLHAILWELRRMKMVLEGIGSSGRPVKTSRHEAIDLALWDALRVLQLQARARKIEIKSNVPAMPLLPLDAAIVRGLLFNLVQNAQHATPAGGHIEVSTWLEPNVFVLKVSDNGEGMTPEQLNRCREIFYSTKTHGTGLGLTICQRVADEAGGALDIVSSRAEGTTVTLRLPT